MDANNVFSLSPVGQSKQQGNSMIKGLNYTIDKTDDNTYRIDVIIKRLGKQYRKRFTYSGGIKQAEREARKIVIELEEKADAEIKQKHSLRSLKTFGECISFYEKNTQTNTESTRHHLNVVKGHLSDVTVEDEDFFQERFDNFISEMRHTVSKRGVVYSPTTINHFIRRIDAVVNFCKRKKVISRQFTFDRDLFAQKSRKRPIEKEEIEKLYEVILLHRPYLLPIVQFAFQIPSRKSELVNMRKDWVDLDNKCITIPRDATKNGEACVKPIPPNMIDYFSSLPIESDFVFYRMVDGKPKSLGDFKKAWIYCKDKAGITDLHFHDSRHYSATQLILKGISERIVMDVAGWKSNMLSTYYDLKSLSASQMVFESLLKS